jgi:hypothetical protein
MQLTYSLNGGSGGGGGGDGTDAVARRQIADLKAAFEAHEEDKDNPHEVTAEQAGAASGFVKEADLVERLAAYAKESDLRDMQLALANHKADFTNPHRVTAEQTGGGGGGGSDVSRQEFDALKAQVESHAGNTNNPHAVTAEQTGATDGGFTAWKAGRNIALGAGASAEGGGQTTALGANTKAIGTFATAVGNNGTTASGGYSTAVGSFAKATATNAVQLGAGENETEGSLQFRDYTLLTGDGVVPAERLPDAVARKADVKSIRTALAAALAGVTTDMPASWEETARRLVDLIEALKAQFGTA